MRALPGGIGAGGAERNGAGGRMEGRKESGWDGGCAKCRSGSCVSVASRAGGRNRRGGGRTSKSEDDGNTEGRAGEQVDGAGRCDRSGAVGLDWFARIQASARKACGSGSGRGESRDAV